MFFKAVDPKKIVALLPEVEQPFLNKRKQDNTSDSGSCNYTCGYSCSGTCNGCAYDNGTEDHENHQPVRPL